MNMSQINDLVLSWWPVAVGIYSCLAGAVTLYTRAVQRRITGLAAAQAAAEDRADGLERALAAHRLHVAETYSTSNEVASLFTQLLEALRRIEDKVERKADKC